MRAITFNHNTRKSDASDLIEKFTKLRDKCPALHEVFLPDSIWQEFREWHSRQDNAGHCSILLLAFQRGQLGRMTAPVHRFLVSSTGILPNVRKQYISDLREKWIFHHDPAERNRLSRIFRGRTVELQFALWLESQSHKVVGLEATRKGPDIETESPDGAANAFEVKFIGLEDGDFRIFLKSRSGIPAGTAVSPYTAIDYLLFRAYEAAAQLRTATGSKTVVVVIDDQTWFRFEMQLTGNWINWKNPRFVSQDTEWTQFLTDQQKRYPDLLNDLAHTIQGIDSVKIFRQTSVFEFFKEYDLSTR